MINRINEIIDSIVELDNHKKYDENTLILRDLKMNSIEFVSLICVIEDEFDIDVSDEDLKRIVTIGDLIAYIESQQ